MRKLLRGVTVALVFLFVLAAVIPLQAQGTSSHQSDPIENVQINEAEFVAPETELEGLIVDDLDEFVPFACTGGCNAPGVGTGYFPGGPSQGWKYGDAGENGNKVHEETAQYTWATNQWRSWDYNNWAKWTSPNPLNGVLEVLVYKPKVITGAPDTTQAEYSVVKGVDGTKSPHDIFTLDQTSQEGWYRLDTYEYNDEYGTVVLRDYTEDFTYTGGRKTILADAVMWRPPQEDDVEVDINVRGWPEGAVIPPNTDLDICFSSSSDSVRLMLESITPDYSRVENVTNHPDGCLDGATTDTPGPRTFWLGAYRGSDLVAEDEANFSVPGPTPTSIATAPPTDEPPTAVPTQRPTATPESGDDNTYVAIVPGYGHSMPNDPSARSPAFPSQLEGMETVLSSAYPNVKFRVCTYRWMDSNVSSAVDLDICIRNLLNGSENDVHIITHSNGALVARAWIQDVWDNRPDRVNIGSVHMIAPPNQGVVSSYYMWAGGDLYFESITSRIATRLMIAVNNPGCNAYRTSCVQEILRTYAPSIQELLPVGERFLEDVDSSQSLVSYADMHPDNRNSFLERLNSRTAQLFSRSQGVFVYRGAGIDTAKHIQIYYGASFGDLWQDGVRVTNNPTVFGEGDGRILSSRAELPVSQNLTGYDVDTFEGAGHNDLITVVQNEIFRKIGLTGIASSSEQAVAQQDSLSWYLVGATKSVFNVEDEEGRKAGLVWEREKVTEIPGSRVIASQNPPSVIVEIPSLPHKEYKLNMINYYEETEEVSMSVISPERTDLVWFWTGQAEGRTSRYGVLYPNGEPPKQADTTIFLPAASNSR